MTKKIYIAGPFFNPEQVAVIEGIEKQIGKFSDLTFYSPRLDGILMNMSKEQRAARKTEIFQANCENIDNSDLILAVIDGRDIGTVWELGYAYATSQFVSNPDIVTYTNQDFGLNVMIQESVDGHLKGLSELARFLELWSTGATNPFGDFRKFNEGVY